MSGENERTIQFKRRLYGFVLRLIKYIKDLPYDRVTKILGDQLLRSGTSILANYIEASASSSRKDYTNFFHYSLKSANETRFWLSVLKDGKLLPAILENDNQFLLKET